MSYSPRAQELHELLDAVQSLALPFITAADNSKAPGRQANGANGKASANSQTEYQIAPSLDPHELGKVLDIKFPAEGGGQDGFKEQVDKVLKWSVNTWDAGFLDKLYASTNPIGIAADLLLSILNTNAHVYNTSPVLTLVEKATTVFLAQLFGLPGPHIGGFSQPGGSASNSSSIVVARNTLYPETKASGNGNYKFRLLTSAAGHYSVEKAAQMFGMGSDSVLPVPVDADGRINVAELERIVIESKAKGETPFYVNATAGTTVFGAYDPFAEISAVCKRHNLWLHIDGSWGGNVVFSKTLRESRLKGAELADSIAITPHKMLGVPLTSSFLLFRDLRQAWKAFTLPAGYLFHTAASEDPDAPLEIYDLADLTPQCGRRGDSLKLFLSLQYYGVEYYERAVDQAFANADEFYAALESKPEIFKIVSEKPLPCLQVCFYYHPEKGLVDGALMTARTAEVARKLKVRGWMIDYAPGPEGKYFRIVINTRTTSEIIAQLVQALEEAGAEAVAEEQAQT